MSFRDIPVNDIKFFLNRYGQPILEDENKLYLSAWNYLISNDNILVPVSIANWVKRYYPYDYKYMNETFGGSIVSKYGKTLITKNNGEVYTPKPKIILGLKEVIKTDVGKDFEIYLTKDGEVYISGDFRNIIDIPTTDDEINLIPNIDNAVDISAGEYHILILLDDGSVLGLGSNTENQLGIEDTETVWRPKLIPNLKNIIAVHATPHISYFLSKDGKIYRTYSDTNIEELGNFNNVKKIIPSEDGLITMDDKIHLYEYRMGKLRENTEYELGTHLNIIDISAFNKTILYFDSSGDVYVTGIVDQTLYNSEESFVDIKIPTKIKGLKDIIYVYNGYDNWFFVDVNYDLYVMGSNLNGELGIDGKEISYPTLNKNIKLLN